MAQKVSVALVDDVDGSEAESTVEFGVDGVQYAIDLSEENAAELRDALGSYVAKARRTGGRKRRVTQVKTTTKTSAGDTADRKRNQAIREWAREQGREVSDRGRIPAEVVQAYDNAH